MNTAYCRDCREFVTTESGYCDECKGDDFVQAEDVIDAAEHRMERRREDV